MEMHLLVNKIYHSIEKLITHYMTVLEDKSISNGNLAVCIIEENGQIHRRMFGTNKPRLRQSYRVAWSNAEAEIRC